MITRLATTGFVCLRCQTRLVSSGLPRTASRLAAQLQPRRYATDNGPSRDDSSLEAQLEARRHITDSRLLREDSTLESQLWLRRQSPEKRPFRDESAGDEEPPSTEPLQGEGDGQQDPQIKRKNKFYLSKGKRLYVKPESLDIDILGKPAEAIVLKPLGTLSRPHKLLEADEIDSDEPTVLEAVDVELIGSPQEVQANIDELKPPDADTIPESEFNEIKEILHNGFTFPQLQEYVEKNRRVSSKPAAVITPEYPWVLEQLPWTPEAAVTNDEPEPLLRGYTNKTNSRKERLVVRLMRECWGVSIQEFVNGRGRLDVRLRDVEFSLLLLGHRRWLQSICRRLLKPEDHIEMFRSTEQMRIIAPRATAQTVLSDINLTLQGMITRSFSLNDITTKNISAAVLREVGRLTNSIVQMEEATRDIHITWVGLEERASNLEDLKETVFRLLLTAYSPTLGTAKLFLPEGSKPRQRQSGPRFIKVHASSEKWPWKARLGSWERYVDATKSTWETRTPWKAPRRVLPWEVKEVQMQTLSQDISKSQILSGDSLDEPSWSLEPATTTTAVFGHILHPQPPSASSASSRSARNNLTGAGYSHTVSELIISPIIPCMVGIPIPWDLPEGAPKSTIIIRFLPSPTDPLSSSAPPIEVSVDISTLQTKKAISSIRAIVGSDTSNILFPSQPVDARVTQTRSFSLPGHAIGSLPSVDPLAAFLKSSRLDPSEGKLATPSRVPKLRLPRRLLISTPKNTSATTHGNEEVEVDYLFAGLEMRRAVVSSFDGWRLVFTSIEAGQGGGRRVEMSLEAVRAPQPQEAAGKETSQKEKETSSETERENTKKQPRWKSFLTAVESLVQPRNMKWIGENPKDKE